MFYAKQILDTALKINESLEERGFPAVWKSYFEDGKSPDPTLLYNHLRNYKTIVLGLPQRSGKTVAVAETVLPGDLLILRNQEFIDFHRTSYPTKHVELLQSYYLTKNYLPVRLEKKVFNRVFVDIGILPSPAFLRNTLKLLGHNVDQQFIFVF